MDLKRKLNSQMIVAIVLSVLFVAGIPMTVLGAVNGLMWLMIFGIIFVVFGFYGAPLVWVSFGVNKWKQALYLTIIEDNILEVSALSLTLNKNPRDVQNAITWLINKRYLKGFYFDGEKLSSSKVYKDTEIEILTCPNCGANVEILLENASSRIVCEHCGTKFSQK